MIKRLFEREVDAELIAVFLFILISGFYIVKTYGIQKLYDALLLWMFPASFMVFLTLLLVKTIERAYRRQLEKGRYIEPDSRH